MFLFYFRLCFDLFNLAFKVGYFFWKQKVFHLMEYFSLIKTWIFLLEGALEVSALLALISFVLNGEFPLDV
jgi:hypothetical protein